MPRGNPRGKAVFLRVTDEEYAEIERKAQENELGISEYGRRAMLGEAWGSLRASEDIANRTSPSGSLEGLSDCELFIRALEIQKELTTRFGGQKQAVCHPIIDGEVKAAFVPPGTGAKP